MPHTVFFSWQIDTESRGGRNFIESALKRAAARIGRDTEIEDAIRDLAIDRDTMNVPGTPPIVDTIFKKIDSAAIFVPDLTFVGERLDGRPTPNPNVLVAYSSALRSLGHGRIVPVMNTVYGEPTGEAVPFDMRHLRNPITYNCPENLGDAERREVRDQLSKQLESAIRAMLDSEEFKSSLPHPPEPPKFVEHPPLDGHGRFRARGESLGLLRDFIRSPTHVWLADGPVCWLRMIPTIDPGRVWSVDELEKLMNSPPMRPVSRRWSGCDFLRGHDGYGVYVHHPDNRGSALAIVFAFTTGEIWSIDTGRLAPRSHEERIVPAYTEVEQDIRRTLVDYAGLLDRLDIKAPYKWIIGMEDLKGRHLYQPASPGQV